MAPTAESARINKKARSPARSRPSRMSPLPTPLKRATGWLAANAGPEPEGLVDEGVAPLASGVALDPKPRSLPDNGLVAPPRSDSAPLSPDPVSPPSSEKDGEAAAFTLTQPRSMVIDCL